MTHLLLIIATFLAMFACGPSANDETAIKRETEISVTTDTSTIAPDSIADDSRTVYSKVINKKNCFIIISKPEYRLYVYEVVDGDTTKRVHYPVCVALNKGQKQKKGDMRTPECTFEDPFVITEIVDASKWTHDFGDGRGSILSYGNWFMRLKTSGFTGIGIHGSTNNESSVPGRGSEGCIRLRNDDLDDLKEHYAYVGMRVVIFPDVE